ncbi:hypothetical protein [Archaeoglobus sp.]
MIEISKEVLDVLKKHGVREFHVFDVEKSGSVEDVERVFKEKFDNAVINVFKVKDDSFRVEVFVLDENLSDAKRSTLETYIYLSGLERFVMLTGDRDLEYVVKKFIKSDKKRVDSMDKMFKLLTVPP